MTAASVWGFLAACGLNPFDVVLVSPIYGYVDGCTEVAVTGRGFSEDVRARLGLQPALGAVLPAPGALERGFRFDILTPPNGNVGPVDLTVIDGEHIQTLSEAFHYVPCPAAFTVDGLSAYDAPANTRVSIYGCSLSTADVVVHLTNEDPAVPPVDLVPSPVCGTATIDFGVPNLPGTWTLTLQNRDGDPIWPAPCVEITTDSGTNCDVPLPLRIVAATETTP